MADKTTKLEKKRQRAIKKQEKYGIQLSSIEQQIAELERLKLQSEDGKQKKQEAKIQKCEAKRQAKADKMARREEELQRLQREKERIRIEKENKRTKAQNEKTEKQNKELRQKVSKDFKKRERYLMYGVDPAEKKKPVKKNNPSIFKLLNPANLQSEIHKYGFNYSFKKLMLAYAIALTVAVVVGFLFKLKLYLILVVAGVALLCTPSLVLTAVKNMYEAKRFHDVSNYLELLLYSFRRKPKILDALKDVYSTFSDDSGTMGQKVAEAIDYMETSQTAGNFEKEALEIIEREYDNNDRMKNVHNFLIAVEANGGDYVGPVDLLLNERAMWDERVHSFQKERASIKRNATISILFSLGLCFFLLYILNSGQLEQLDILHHKTVQITSTAAIVASTLLYVFCNNKLSSSWLERKNKYSDYQKLKNYFNATEFDTKGEILSALVFVAIVAPILLFAILKGIKWLIVISGVMELFFILSPFIAKKTATKQTKKEIEIAFPQWLMELALLLQSDTVQVAISKSLATSPVVLRPELTKLVEAFTKEPNSIRPYQNFMKQFDIPSISSAMGMLYSINESGQDAIGEQITDLIDKQNKLIDKSERLSNEDSLAGLDALKMLPMLVCIFKSLIDMTVLVMALLTFVNTVG